MTRPTIETPEALLAAVLFNAGLQQHQAGRTEDALVAFSEAVRLDPGQLAYAVVACKASFASMRWDEARSYLMSAEAAGLARAASQRMSRAIERAVAVSESSQVPVRFEPGPPDPPRASWMLAFCDWLESAVHEACQELRQAVSSGHDRK